MTDHRAPRRLDVVFGTARDDLARHHLANFGRDGSSFGDATHGDVSVRDDADDLALVAADREEPDVAGPHQHGGPADVFARPHERDVGVHQLFAAHASPPNDTLEGGTCMRCAGLAPA